MDIKSFIAEWIRLSNAFDTAQYLEKYTEDAVLDDPSVGRKFIGHEGIKAYYTNYFVEYKTQTKLLKLIVHDGNKAHLEVAFTGDFPEGNIEGTFDFTFKGEKIATIKADLMS